MKKKWLAAIAAVAVAGAGIGMITACSKESREEEHTHTYSTVWSKNDTQHWFAATCEHGEYTIAKADHAWDNGTEVTAATEEEAGSIKYTCVVCKAEKTESIDILGHTYSSDWKADGDNHWHAATCGHGEKSGEAAHSYGEWESVIAATHTDKGLEKKVCTVCNYTATRETDTTGEHTYNESAWAADSTGHWWASDCGHYGLQKDFSAHNFALGTGKINGYMIADNSKTVEEGKCNFAGYHYQKCGNCGYEVWSKHDRHTVEEIQAHGCLQDGITDVTCSCGYKWRETRAASHSFYTAWTSDETYHWHAMGCEHADDPAYSSLITKEEHEFTGGETKIEDGKKVTVKECMKCGYEDRVEVPLTTDFDLSVQYVNTTPNQSTTNMPVGTAVMVENEVIHIKPDAEMNFDFVNVVPAESQAGFVTKDSRDLIKVYEVFANNEKVELTDTGAVMLLDLNSRTLTSGSDTVYFRLKVNDGQQHKIYVETEAAHKEFTVIPDVEELNIKYSLDNGATWTDYTAPVTVNVGQKVLLTGSASWYSCSGSYFSMTPTFAFGEITFVPGEDIAGMNKITEMNTDVAADYSVTLGLYNVNVNMNFSVIEA